MRFSLTISALLRSCAVAVAAISLSSCANCLERAFADKPYFGDPADGVMTNSYVPREVQRVDPWLPLF